MRSRRPRSIRSTFVAVVLSITAAAMVFQSVAGFDPLGVLIGRAAIQTIGIKAQERDDRAAVNARRDVRLADVAAEEAGLTIKLDRGWLSREQVERERARLDEKRKALAEVALRERQIVSYQARHRIRRAFTKSLRDGIVLVTGVDPRAADFITSLVRGENPLKAAVAAAMSEKASVDPRQGFRDLRDSLRDVEVAARALGGGKTIAIRARVADALREVTGLADGRGPPPDDQLGRLQRLTDSFDDVASRFSGVLGELAPERPGIARDRFDHDERWVSWDALINHLDAPTSKQAITSAILRRSADRAVAIAAGAGLTLTEAELAIIATDAALHWVEQRRAAGAEPGMAIDIDALVRASIDGLLAVSGRDPLPEPEMEETGVAPVGEEPEPIRRRFVGEGAWDHRAWDHEDQTCSIDLTVKLELTLEPDGTVALFIGDTVWNRHDGDELVCFVNGAAQLYSGTWAPVSESDTAATILFGSSGEEFQVPVAGDMPSGTAGTTVHNNGNTWETSLVLELREVE